MPSPDLNRIAAEAKVARQQPAASTSRRAMDSLVETAVPDINGGRWEQFGLTASGLLLHRRPFRGSWTDWKPMGQPRGTRFKKIATEAQKFDDKLGSRYIDLFAVDSTGHLWHRWWWGIPDRRQYDCWYDWEDWGDGFEPLLTVTNRGPARIEVAARRGGRWFHRQYISGWNGWSIR